MGAPPAYFGCAKTDRTIVSSVGSGKGVSTAGPPSVAGINSLTVPCRGIAESSVGMGPCAVSGTSLRALTRASAAVTVEGDALGLIWTVIPSGPWRTETNGAWGMLHRASVKTAINDSANPLTSGLAGSGTRCNIPNVFRPYLTSILCPANGFRLAISFSRDLPTRRFSLAPWRSRSIRKDNASTSNAAAFSLAIPARSFARAAALFDSPACFKASAILSSLAAESTPAIRSFSLIINSCTSANSLLLRLATNWVTNTPPAKRTVSATRIMYPLFQCAIEEVRSCARAVRRSISDMFTPLSLGCSLVIFGPLGYYR